MNGGDSKARTRRSRVQLSKALQETLLDAVAGSIADLPRSHREQSPESGDPAGDTTPVQARKRRLDTTESDPSPAKRARLTRTDTQQPGVDEKAEQADTTTLQQPKPNPPKHPYAAFLRDFVEPVHPSPRPASVHTFVSQWLESIGSDREKRCRSDSHLLHSDGDPISRQLTRSAPDMGYTRDADGFAVPPTPASTGSRSYRASYPGSVAPSDLTDATPGSGRSSGRSLVEDPFYRSRNLAANDIYMRHPCDPIPEHITDLVDYVRQDRDSPGPSADEVRQDRDLYDLSMGAGEPQVEEYFRTNIYPYPKSTESLQRADRQPMAKHTVPNTGSKLKTSNPVPDMLYGYSSEGLPQQQAQLISMGTEMVANNQGLMYPFFVIEFKGDGPSGSGSLWVATNQCLGGSTSCVNIAERLNHQLRKCKSEKIRPINGAAFSIAMSGTEARLYISWRHNELDCYMANVKSFLLQEPEQYIEFRKYVRNIIDWGKDKRLNEIRTSLDSLLEESRQRASMAAKSRQPPSDGSGTSSSKKQRSSSSRRNSGRSNSAQAHSGETNEPDWELNYPEVDQQDQSRALASFDSAAEPAGFATSASGFTSNFGTYGHEASHGPPPSSYRPPQQQNFVETDDYISQHINDGPALPEYHYPEDDQQDQGQALVSFDAAAEPPASFATVPPTEEQPTAAADDYWTWSGSRKKWYHLNGDGSREWYMQPQRGSHK